MGIVIRVDGQAERPRVRVAGTVQAIRRDRIGGMPALEAELRDGAGLLGLGHLDLGYLDLGCLDLIWLGRASIPGIEPGITVVAEGRLAVRRGRATMFNPRYELSLAAPDASSEQELRAVS